MDVTDLGETGSGCEEKDCSLVEEPMFGLIELVCVTVIYVPLMLCGLMGNILTILVVVLRPHMRSSTYLYLSSMSVSDLLILLLLPLDLYKLWRPRPWPLGDLACKLTMFLSECCTFCTILHITFLSLERCLAVCWPIAAKTLVTRRRTRTVIGCLWLGAAVSAAPVLVMVGVEDVGGEELGLANWKEDGGWRRRTEAEQRGAMANGEGLGHVTFLDGGMERTLWEGRETEGWDETFGGEEEKEGEATEKKEEEDGERRAEGGEEDAKATPEGGRRNKKKEDEGGGRERVLAPPPGLDTRECRCTHYAVSSGLLSAMMILSNLYFLIPLGVLGLVYGLIGRTLCLRPKSSRRDQSHRHTNRMLGVIVLAFVLCWLPFHVGRTIFSLSVGGGLEDYSEPYADPDDDAASASIRSDSPKTSETAALIGNGREAPTDICSSAEVTANTTPVGKHANSSSVSYRSAAGFNATRWRRPDQPSYFLYYLSQYFNLVSSVLFYLSAAVNPLLYNLMSARYRRAVHSLVRAHAHGQRHRLRTMTTRQHSTTML
ncbi:unnamed protein product [Ophioblennius macclurei]